MGRWGQKKTGAETQGYRVSEMSSGSVTAMELGGQSSAEGDKTAVSIDGESPGQGKRVPPEPASRTACAHQVGGGKGPGLGGAGPTAAREARVVSG